MQATDIGTATVERFSERLRGEILRPDEEGYDEARRVWNAMIDKEPAVIARCRGAADVMTAVDFARDHDLLLSVRGGGHNVAGTAVCDGGLTIDLSPMNSVRVDPETRTARVGGGATWGEFDHEAQAFGLATTGGVVSSTGVAGLTLGGGFGWLAREHGLACDNLRSADVVTADGELVHASEDENADLFWALRGGGGNFGVVTSFEFDLHEVGPTVLAGPVIYRYEDATEALRFYREFMTDASERVQCLPILAKGRPELGLPDPFHGETVLVLLAAYSGDIDAGREALQPLRTFGEPLADAVEPMPYTALQRMLDEQHAEGYRWYWKSQYVDALSDAAIETIVDYCESTAPFFAVFGEWMGGAISHVEGSATAFPHRDRTASVTVEMRWTDPDRDDEHVAWAREFHEALAPDAADGVYVNYLSRDEADRVPDAYGDRYERLRRVKAEWDPENLFRVNQNVEPTG
jgi:FAD/FMN-containing dehydrogenase